MSETNLQVSEDFEALDKHLPSHVKVLDLIEYVEQDETLEWEQKPLYQPGVDKKLDQRGHASIKKDAEYAAVGSELDEIENAGYMVKSVEHRNGSLVIGIQPDLGISRMIGKVPEITPHDKISYGRKFKHPRTAVDTFAFKRQGMLLTPIKGEAVEGGA